MKVEALAKEFIPLLDAARFMFACREPDFSEIADEQSRSVIHLLHLRLYESLQALFELKSVYDDVLLTLRMSASFPWRSKEISKSDHLKMVWFQHVNLCYLFEEKLKLVRKVFEVVANLLPEKFNTERLKGVQKRVDAALKKQIQSRGQTFHEWYQHHETLKDYRIIELADKFDGGPRTKEVAGLYRLTKQIIRSEIHESARFMHECMIDIVRKEGCQLATCLGLLEKVWELAKNEPSKVQAEFGKRDVA